MKIKGGYFSAYINILKACIGGGILTYPFLMQQHGIVLTVLYTIIYGSISYFSCILYMVLNDQHGRNNTISSLTKYSIPSLKVFVDIVLILKCFIVSLSYLTLVFEMIERIFDHYKTNLEFLKNISSLNCSRLFFTILVLLLAPFVGTTSIEKLKKFSVLGIIGVFLLLTTSLNFIKSKEDDLVFIGELNPIKYIGLFVFGFTCHQNILTTQNESRLSSKNLFITIFLVYLTTFFMYIFFGFLNYYNFSDIEISPQISNSWPKCRATCFALISYILLITMSLPLQLNPIKNYILQSLHLHDSYSLLIGAILLFILYLIAISKIYTFYKHVKFVSQTFSAILVFFIPSLLYFLDKGKKSNLYIFMAFSSLIVGCLAFIKTVIDF